MNNALSKEITQFSNASHVQPQMPFPFLSLTGYDFMKDGNASILNEELAGDSAAPEEVGNRTSQHTGFSGGIPHTLFPISLNREGVSYLQFKTVPANSKIIFLNTNKSIFNTEWDGYSDLADLLKNMGFNVEERDVNPITYNQIKDYDVIVTDIPQVAIHFP